MFDLGEGLWWNPKLTERGGELRKCPKQGANVEWPEKAPQINEYTYKLAIENVSVPSVCHHNHCGSWCD